jgi:hypothetical protein
LIVGRAHTYAAPDHPVSISDRATAFLGAEYVAVLIHCALALAAHHVAILILDAIPCTGLSEREDQETTENESALHVHPPRRRRTPPGHYCGTLVEQVATRGGRPEAVARLTFR